MINRIAVLEDRLYENRIKFKKIRAALREIIQNTDFQEQKLELQAIYELTER